MEDLVVQAREFATNRHEGQTRRDKKTPYIVHPVRVADRLLRAGVERPELLAAAVLHDTIEDTATSYEEIVVQFGPEVAGWVQEATREPGVIRRTFMERAKAGSPQAVLLRLADRLDNLEDDAGLEHAFRPVYAREALRLLAYGLHNPRLDELSPGERAALRDLGAQLIDAALEVLGLPDPRGPKTPAHQPTPFPGTLKKSAFSP